MSNIEDLLRTGMTLYEETVLRCLFFKETAVVLIKMFTTIFLL